MSKKHFRCRKSLHSFNYSCTQVDFDSEAFGIEKRLSNPWDYARPEDCAELPRVKIVTLSAPALYDQDSLILSLTSDSIPNTVLKSLVDSGSSNSFINSGFVQTQHLLTHNIPPIQLCVMDGTSNSVITQALDLAICFPTGETQNLTFFVTPLDQGCTIVLGFHWLTRFNPSIDWVLGHIIFCQSSQPEAKTSPPVETLSSAPTPALPSPVPDPETPLPPVKRKPP